MKLINKNGFGLIEFMMVGAFASILMLGTMSMLGHVNRSQKSSSQSIAFDNLVLLITLVLHNPLTCPTALQASSGAPVTLPTSITAAAPDLPAEGISVSKIFIGTLLLDTSVPYDGMYIQTMQLKQIVVGSPSTVAPIPYVASLHVTGSKTPSGRQIAVGGGFLMRDIPISLNIQTPAGGGPASITACSSKPQRSLASGGGGDTLLTDPVLVAYSSVGAVPAGIIPPGSVVQNSISKLHQWVRVPLTVPTGTGVAKVRIFNSQGMVYVSGKGQTKPLWTTRYAADIFPMNVSYSMDNAANTTVIEVPLEDDGSFSFLLHNNQSTVSAFLTLVGYR